MGNDNDWEDGLAVGSPTRSVADILLRYEMDLSDGYGYYCNKDTFQNIVKEIVKAVLEHPVAHP